MEKYLVTISNCPLHYDLAEARAFILAVEMMAAEDNEITTEELEKNHFGRRRRVRRIFGGLTW